MQLIALIAILISFAYACLILYILYQWNSQAEYTAPAEPELPKFSYTILIAARNEEQNIGPCIKSLLDCKHFLFYKPEIVVVDDFSYDDTISNASAFGYEHLRFISLADHIKTESQGGKKVAIATAINEITADYIIQLDADVTVNPEYLHTLITYIETGNADFIAGSVNFVHQGNIFTVFQALDFYGMMAVTQAGIFSKNWYMANGANMSYKRLDLAFESSPYASGDDVYAIQHFNKINGEIKFLKSREALVYTKAESKLSDFIRQRIRWASKNRSMKSSKMQVMMLIPFLNAIFFFLCLGLWIATGHVHLMIALGNMIFINLAVDYVFLKELSAYYGSRDDMRYFIASKLMSMLYICLIGGMSAFVGSYNWKERRVQ